MFWFTLNMSDPFSARRTMMERANKASASASAASGASYSTMSLPRRMPVKKLVSAFNAHYKVQGSWN